MSPRFLTRMASQMAMQMEWHRATPDPSPPSYPQSDLTPISHDSLDREELPSYQRVSRSCSAPPVYIQHQISHTEIIVDLYSFPRWSTILVVGAYTRQGMHIIDRLIEHGHQVRGIVSNVREAAQVSKHFEALHGRGHYHSSIVTDLTVEGALDSTASACSGVIFVATNSSPIASSNEERLAGVFNALTSAMKAASVDRFIYCTLQLAACPFNQTSTVSEDVDSTSRATKQHPRPSNWLNKGGAGESNVEENPIELAIGKWMILWEPGFALQTVSLPRNFGAVVDSVFF